MANVTLFPEGYRRLCDGETTEAGDLWRDIADIASPWVPVAVGRTLPILEFPRTFTTARPLSGTPVSSAVLVSALLDAERTFMKLADICGAYRISHAQKPAEPKTVLMTEFGKVVQE